jgi:alpha-mannosidase
MLRRKIGPAMLAALTLGVATAGMAQTGVPPKLVPHPTDLSQGDTLYLVGYAHLDTQWRWSYPQVIREFIANTMNNNFRLFEKYPDYVFNFSGSRRYEMMREYYPEDYAKVKQYVKSGQWFPCGSSVDEGDSNVPSAESLVRHTLYGNHYFMHEFGVASQEFMLPDCFGFTYSLPTILAHCGVKEFSTQKLTWGSAVGIPFPVGTWEGPDGRSIVAALDPGSYSAGFNEDLSQNTSWLTRIENTGKKSGTYVDYHYYGTGDRGGAPDERSVAWMEKSIVGPGKIKVVSSKADEMVKTMTPAEIAKLPHYKGELLLTAHSAGSITSEAYMKRWNRKNELLADSAERASVAAMWLGSAPYPTKRLYDAWDLVLGSQMHDMLPGTSLPQAYQYCWNDELLALNQFGAVTQDAVGAVSESMDTRAKGVALVVYNPLAAAREDVVEATVTFPGPAPAHVQVYGPEGTPVPTQIVGREGDGVHLLFLAHMPSLGFVSFDARPATGAPMASPLKVDRNTIENARFRVTLNDAGEIASVYDKINKKESLKAPARLAFQYENPSQFPAWNMDWADAQKPPREYVNGPVHVRVLENGPVRVALEVTRETDGSRFVQTIRLAAGGAGDRVEVANKIDWQTPESALKASFPFTTANPMATYDLQVGAIQRGNDDPKKYEVPQHQWFDLTGTDGKYGVAVLNDCKFGGDKPDDDTMRLTLLYTPGTRAGYQDQGTQDFGKHDILYALAPHTGGWQQANVPWTAKRLNQPLKAFQAPSHPGSLGRTFSIASVSSPQVEVSAIKKAEDSGEIVVRLRELHGTPVTGVQLKMAAPIIAAREVSGQEAAVGPATVKNGVLVTDMRGFGLRAFALKLAKPTVQAPASQVKPLTLAYNQDVVSFTRKLTDGGFDKAGRTFSGEQMPASITADGVAFDLGPTADGAKNAIACHGQKITLPAGYGRVYLLAASEGDAPTHFTVGQRSYAATVQDWGGFIGQWDNRLWLGDVPELTYDWHNEIGGLTPGYVKPAEVAWFCSHRHNPTSGNEFYQYSYLYKYGFDIPAGATTLTLPNDPRIRVFAVSVAKGAHDAVRAAEPLFDTLADHRTASAPEITPTISPAGGHFSDVTTVTLVHPLYWRAGGLHYTLDGTTPTAASPAYTGPITLSDAATVRAAEIDGDGPPMAIASARFDVHDTTPPTVTGSQLLSGLPQATVMFSEPVTKDTAEQTANYKFDKPLQIKSAVLAPDAKSVVLTLDQPAADGDTAQLTVTGVKDVSPAGNVLVSQTVTTTSGGRVYASGPLTLHTSQAFNVSALPTKARDSWTINLFCKMDHQPDNRTVIAGFGRDNDGESGTGRYLAKFANGIHFWSANQDVDTTTQFDLGQWQMITATYDGQTLRLYKNGAPIGEGKIKLSNDEARVHVMPTDPWEHERVLDGQVRDMTIWTQALTPEQLQLLYANGKGQ